MDIDVAGLAVHILQKSLMKALESSGLVNTLRTFGFEDLRLPDLARAKQTETVQRFKIGLLTSAGQELPTKIEFSRHGPAEGIRSEAISSEVLATYRLAPVIVPHYDARSAARQKIRALFSRAQPQARDIFDLYLLSSQPDVLGADLAGGFAPQEIREGRERICSLDYEIYRDAVVNFLGPLDRAAYDSTQAWDEIRLRVVAMLEGNEHDDK